MTYELAKKLKDGGFVKVRLCGREDDHEIDKCGECDCEHYPTLSELIEACGKQIGFSLLEVDESELLNYDQVSWEASSYNKKAIGSTPEESVANLWLELNKI